MDLVIEARGWVQGGLRDVEIGVDATEGRIVAVKRNLPGRPRKRYRGQLLFPSAVDWHVHFRDPGNPEKEDFRSGTIGAARGGVGTVFDMPNTRPLVDRRSRLRDKADAVAPKACVDWGLWATVTPQTRDLDALLAEANGVKLFLAPTTGVERPLDDEGVRRVLAAARSAGRWTVVHAEQVDPRPAARSAREYDAARPASAEVAAIRGLARIAQRGDSIHVAHVTTEAALAAATEAGFSAGATPHHLLCSFEALPDARGKVNPPLRSEADRKSLWRAFAGGAVPHVESDHAPHTLAEKRFPFAEAPAGVPGVETMMPLLLHLAKRGDVPLAAVVSAACERPAAAMGLDRGRLAAGQRADFFLVNPQDATPLRGDRLAGPCGWTPFEGRSALLPTTHYLGGDLVVEDGEFVGKRGRGRRVPAAPRPVLPPAEA